MITNHAALPALYRASSYGSSRPAAPADPLHPEAVMRARFTSAMSGRFTPRQMPGAICLAGGLAWSIYSGHWAGYLIGLGLFYAGAIVTLELYKWSARRKVRRILADNPHLAYLVAIEREFGEGDHS